MRNVSVIEIAVILLSALPTCFAVDYYIAPDGNDSNSGTKEQPFATLERARDAIRRFKMTDQSVSVMNVWLRGGFYEVTKGFELSELDSGSKNAPVVYRAFNNEEVHIVGGRKIDASVATSVKDIAVLKQLLPEVRDKVLQIDLRAIGITDYGIMSPHGFRRPYVVAPMEVFFNYEAMQIARWPNVGEELNPIGKVIDPGSNPREGDYSNRGGVFSYDTDRPNRWKAADDIWISGFFHYGYADDTIKVKKIDNGKKYISTVHPTMYQFSNESPWCAWYALNLLEEIDLPGEYFIDREKGILYFYPPVPMEKACIQVSMLEEPIVILERASNIIFRDLIFECSRGTGIYIEGGEGNLIAGCTLRNMGTMGIQMGRGIRPFETFIHLGTGQPISRQLGSWHEHVILNNTFLSNAGKNQGVVGCDIYNMGSGGIHLNGGDRRTLEPGNNYVLNCHLHHCNRLDRSYKSMVNIDGVGNRVAHCLFHDAPTQAIYLRGNDHVIEYNTIYHTVEDAEDMGSFYTFRDPTALGTIIRYNFWYHNNSKISTVIATLYFDGASGTTVFGNVFFQNFGRSIFVNAGQYNRINNNIFIGCPLAANMPTITEEEGQGTDVARDKEWHDMLKNIDLKKPPYSVRYPYAVDYGQAGWWKYAHNQVSRNVIYKCGKFLKGYAAIKDNLVTNEDIGFVNPARMGFKLREDSIVYKKLSGFEEIPFEKIGPYPDEYRKVVPLGPPIFVEPVMAKFCDRIKVVLQVPADELLIYYTLDGTVPTEASRRYLEPIELTQSTRIRARAFSLKYKSLGEIASKEFEKIDGRRATECKIKFQPLSSPKLDGWCLDTGKEFHMQDCGYLYGWSKNNSYAVRRRGKSKNNLLDTLIHFSPGVVWQIAVENGLYAITFSVGDSQYASSKCTIKINDIECCHDLSLSANQFEKISQNVLVKDNNIIISSNESIDEEVTRINYVIINKIK